MRFSRIVLVVSLAATLALAVTVDSGETRPAKAAAPDHVRVAVCDDREPAAGRTVSLVVLQRTMRCAPVIASPSPDFAPLFSFFAFAEAELVRAVEFVGSQIPAVVTQPEPRARELQPAGGGGGNEGGTPSEAHWIAIAQCESGNTNGWRTGFLGIEAGYPIGNLSWGEQVAWANRIYAQHGPGAWGCKTDIP